MGRPAEVKEDKRRLFVFGLGYTGMGVASFFQKRGWQVAGTCRSNEKREQLEQRGITAFVFDPSEFHNLGGKALECLRHATHVLSTVPPGAADDQGDPVLLAHAQQLSEHAGAYKWVGYISSTSVYGDYEGEWVDEGSELRAAGGKGWSRVMAEHEWLALHDSFGLPVHIFRCGGIYGPRRSAIEAVQRLEGSSLPGGMQWRPSASQERRERQQYTARCHVFDICQVLEASLQRPNPGAAYNVADDDPADRRTVMQFAAELLARQAAGESLSDRGSGSGSGSLSNGTRAGASSGEGGSSRAAAGAGRPGSRGGSTSGSDDSGDEAAAMWQGLPRARSRPRSRREAAEAVAQLEEKRVRNARIKQELGVRLRFPTYREGLCSIAGGETCPYGQQRLEVANTYPEPETEKERSPIDYPQEWITPQPSRRPDIFPEFEKLQTPMPKPMPGDPEMPDEEEEEEKEKKPDKEDPDEDKPKPDEPAPSEE
ncbi:hypothetical protein D9Q98_008716 [Chlorella vulgaris]|uniref:NAD-dependent epimerase/dehydratase domain-containing protein n=1 Tax=Chlorella vulgaris TaxID=3077 RepID=A0A9D4YU00_CHLVU|nr:hypothetical protein D9Q98_008716 [Chlorella vulgaris]